MRAPKAFRKTEVPVYGGLVVLYLSIADWAKACDAYGIGERTDTDEVRGRCTTVECEDYGAIYIVGWYDGKPSTLVHELSHACFFILKRAGISPAQSNGEAFCYLLDTLCSRFGFDAGSHP